MGIRAQEADLKLALMEWGVPKKTSKIAKCAFKFLGKTEKVPDTKIPH